MNNVGRSCTGVLVMTALIGGNVQGNGLSAFDAATVERTGSFDLDMTAGQALPLFTAPGEKLWISTWDPVVLNGDGYEKGTVFVTNHHGHTTYWLVTDYDTSAHHAQYVRTTPGVDIGTVDLSISANGKERATVRVTYRLTALSAAGNKKLAESFGASDYAGMMQDWRTMIAGSQEGIDKHFGR